MEFIASFGAGVATGYAVAGLPPTHDPQKEGARVLVLSCIDARYSDTLAWFMTHNSAHSEFDLISLAGSALGAVQTEYSSWNQTFLDHLEIAVDQHGVKEVWIIDHLNCSFYKAHYGNEIDSDASLHHSNIRELRDVINTQYPDIIVKPLLVASDGTVSPVTL